MRLKLCITILAVLLLRFSASASTPDSSVAITDSKINCRFVWNSSTGNVEIKQKLINTYTANYYQVIFPVTQFYNDYININDVSCKVDGHTPKGFDPQYTYYSEEDVFYSDARICYFPLPLTHKGSYGTVTFDETIKDPRYFTNIYLADLVAVQHMEISLTIPRWMKVDIKEMNFNGYNVQKASSYSATDDADIITYNITNAPAMNEEPNSPGPTYIYPHLLILCKSANVGGKQINYFNTVADQYEWYHQLVKDINKDNASIAAKAKEITAGITGDMDKIKAIYYYVQNNIRYIAFENGLAGFKPAAAEEVLSKKYGDCKGMANLTKALLVSLGYDARLCWLGTNHIAYDYQTPSMAVDNHMICALIYKGKTYYLDATESYIGFNEYAERIQGREVLMEDGDKYVLNKVPYAAPTQDADEESDKLSIQGTSLVGKVDHIWKGEDKEEVLFGINSVKNEDASEAMTKYLSNDNNDYSINNLVLSSTSSRDKDLTASYDLDFKNAVNSFSKELYIDMDSRKELSNMTFKPERKHDYWFRHKTRMSVESELDIPADYKAGNVPQNLNIVNPDYEFHINYTLAPGKLIYKKSIIIKNIIVNKAKFAQWNNDIEQLNKTYNQTVTLKPVSQ